MYSEIADSISTINGGAQSDNHSHEVQKYLRKRVPMNVHPSNYTGFKVFAHFFIDSSNIWLLFRTVPHLRNELLKILLVHCNFTLPSSHKFGLFIVPFLMQLCFFIFTYIRC